jgi:nitroreductase
LGQARVSFSWCSSATRPRRRSGWAPSGGDSQPWEFIVIKRKETKDRIADLFIKSIKPVRQAELTREKDLRIPALEIEMPEPGFKNAPVFTLYVVILERMRLAH